MLWVQEKCGYIFYKLSNKEKKENKILYRINKIIEVWVQELGGETVGTNRKTTIKFRIDENIKKDFLELCKIKESTMSNELKKFIESELEVERIIKSNNKIVRLKYEKWKKYKINKKINDNKNTIYLII